MFKILRNRRREKNKTGFKPFSAIFLMVVVCLLVLIPAVSAAEFDNVKSYNPETKIVTIKNAFGLGDTIGQAKLLTPLNVQVGDGYQVVAKFEISAYQDYNDALKQFTFIDMKSKQKINRDYDLKYLTYEEIDVDDYEQECEEEWVAGSGGYDYDCWKVVVGTHKEQREVWTKITPADLKKNEVLIVGVFTDVKTGDYVDWIPVIYGVEVDEWATWEGVGLNANLISYYEFEETSGSVLDAQGNYNFSNNGATAQASGKLDYAYSYDGNDWIGGTTIDKDSYNTGLTYNVWVNMTTAPSSTYSGLYVTTETGGYGISGIMVKNDLTIYYAFGDGTAGSAHDGNNVGFSLNVWHMLTATHNTTSDCLYYDGSLVTCLASGTMINGGTTGNFGRYAGGSPAWYLVGSLDEAGIWGDDLTQEQITALYNDGLGLALNHTEGSGSPVITLNSPASANYTTDQNLEINFTASDDSALVNVSLFVNNVLNQTNSSGINNTNYIFDLSLSDGIYNIKGSATDNESQTTNSSTIIIFIDTIDPAVSISAPNGSLGAKESDSNVSLNWTATDTNINSCWYDYNGTNTSVPCGDPGTLFIQEFGVNNLTFYANDTLGNVGSASTSWTYDVVEISQSYYESVLEGDTSPFSANFSITNAERISSVEFIYNGSSSLGTYTEYSSGLWYLEYEKLIPEVTADTNVTFYWNILLENDASYNSSFNNQTIVQINIDNCSAYSNQILNLSMVDEATQAVLNGATENTTIKVDLTLSYADGSGDIIEYSKLFDKQNPARVCMESPVGNSTLSMSALIEYSSGTRYVEFYNIQDYVFENGTESQNITLYNLKEDEGQEFKITYKGEDFVPVTDLIVQIQRKYIDEGVFKVIEIPMSGSSGYTIAHLVPNDVIYNFIFIKDGAVLDTFTEVIANCQNPTITECEINLNALITGSNMMDLVSDDDFFASLSYNKTTRRVSSVFGIISGVTGKVDLNVTLVDNFGNNSVCSDTLTAAGGSLSCVVPVSFGNSTIYAAISYNGEIKREGFISQAQNPKDQYGGILIFSSIIMLMFMFGIGISDNPAITGVFLIIGSLLLVGLNLVYSTSILGAGATILWFVVAVLIVIIKGSGKR